MSGQVHVEHHIVFHVFQLLQTFAILRLVEVYDDIPQLRLELEKQLEGIGRKNLLVKLRPVIGGQCAQPSISGHILRK